MKRKKSSTTLKARMEKLQKQYDAAKEKFGKTDSRYTKDVQRMRMNNALEKIRSLKKNNPDVFKSTKMPPPPPAADKSTKSIFGGGTPPGERALKNIGEKMRSKKPGTAQAAQSRRAKKNEDKPKPARTKTTASTERKKQKSPAPITETRDLKAAPGSKLRENAISSARKAEAASKRKAADRRAEKDKGPRGVRTETKRPGRFSEEAGKKFFKEKFGIDVTYDKGDELDPLVARGEEPGRRKGGLFTKRGALYNKPARKN